MKKYTILLCLLAVLSFSCKKDKQDKNNYYFVCTIDGVQKEFNTDAFGTLEVDNSGEFLTVSASESNSANSAAFGFSISNQPGNQPILTGIYDDDWDEYQADGVYSPDGVNVYQAGATLKAISDQTSVPIGNHLKLEIKQIANGTISGTISGDFHLDADPSEPKKVVTNGSFFLPLTNP